MEEISSISSSRIVELLHDSKIGILPTDTLYGLVAKASDQLAVKRLYELKNRDKKPGTVVAASVDQLVGLGIKHRYLKAVEQYWPGPISVVIPTGHDLNYLHQSVGGLAVRIPKDQTLLKLLQKTGPLLTSSANTPGDPPANTMAEAKGYFKDKVDFYADGGNLSSRQPSTVIRIVDDAIKVLRAGAVKIDENGRIK